MPASVRLAFGDGDGVRLSPWPVRLAHPAQNARLLVTVYRTLVDLKRSRLVSLYLESTLDRILRFSTHPRSDTDGPVRGGIVYVPADVDLGRPAQRLDVYLATARGHDADEEEDSLASDSGVANDHDNYGNGPPVPVIVLLAFASYRQAGDVHSSSFPTSNLARQLQSTLGVCVVVPALTPFPSSSTAPAARRGETVIERMVAETRECVKWVGENAARYGADPSKVWLMGYGAGAHIVSVR